MSTENQVFTPVVTLNEAQIDNLKSKVKDEKTFINSMFIILASYTQVTFNLEILKAFYKHCSTEIPNFATLFADCISRYLLLFIGEEVQNKVKDFCIQAIDSEYISPLQIAQGLPSEFLVKLNLINTKKELTTAAKPCFTDNFTQKIFNLYREESEGYAFTLDLIISLPKYQDNLESVLAKLIELTDAYSLNPVRILDTILLAIPYHIINHKELCIDLIKLLPFYSQDSRILHSQYFKELLGSLIGSRLSQSSDEEDSTIDKSEIRLSCEFYLMIAILIQEDLLDFYMILSNMTPYTDFEENIYTEKLDRESNKNTNQRPDNEPRSPASNEDFNSRPTYTSTQNSQLEPEDLKETQISKFVEALLFCGDMTHAEIICLKFDKILINNNTAASFATKGILRMLEGKIQELAPIDSVSETNKPRSDNQPEFSAHPIYSDENQEELFPNVYYNLKEFPLAPNLLINELDVWFNALDAYIGQDVTLMYELLKIFKDILLSPDYNQAVKDLYFKSFVKYMLPAYTYSDSTAALAPYVWDILKSLDQKKRFRSYDCWKDLLKNPVSLLQDKITESIKSIQEVTLKASMENAAESGSAYNRLITSCPFPCLDELFQQIFKSDDAFPNVSESFKYLSEMSLDLVTYGVLSFFYNEYKSKKIYKVELDIAPWFQRFSAFIAMTHKRVLSLDLKPILLLVADKLADGEIEFMCLLASIINYLIGIDYKKNPNNHQIRAMAAAPSLKAFHCKFQHQDDLNLYSNSNSKDKWFLAFESMPNLPSIISVAFLQHAHKLLFSLKDVQKTKIVCGHYDAFFAMFLLFIDTFDYNSNPSIPYFDSLPKFDELISKYGVDPGIAFHILRPNLASKIKNINDSIASDNAPSVEIIEKNFYDVVLPKLEPILGNILDSYPTMLQDQLQLYINFFSLSLRDIYSYDDDYRDCINTLETEANSIINSNNSSKEESKKANFKLDNIGVELDSLYYERTKEKRRYLGPIKFEVLANTWFKPPKAVSYDAYSLIAKNFFQNFLLPRIMISPSEALFCSQFIIRTHKAIVKKFPIFLVLEVAFESLKVLLKGSTTSESSNLGVFINDILNFVKPAHQSGSYYDTNFVCDKHFGFANYNTKRLVKMTHESFCKKVARWHNKLHFLITESISNSGSIYMNNVITFGDSIKENFPILRKQTEDNIYLINKRLLFIEKSDANKLRAFADGLKSLLPNLVNIENFRKGIYKNTELSPIKDDEEFQNKFNNDLEKKSVEENGITDRGQKRKQTSPNVENITTDPDRGRDETTSQMQGSQNEPQNTHISAHRSNASTSDINRRIRDQPQIRHNDGIHRNPSLRNHSHENLPPRTTARRQRDDYNDQYSTANMRNSHGGNHDRRRIRQSNHDQHQDLQTRYHNNIDYNRYNYREDNRYGNRRYVSPDRYRYYNHYY